MNVLGAVFTVAALTSLQLTHSVRDVMSEQGMNSLMAGTYEFEMMGRPHRLYVCDDDIMTNDTKAIYWSVTDVTHNEYTIALGRDRNGVESDGNKLFVARSDVFRLYGDIILSGYYEIVFNKETAVFTLRERFPELEIQQEKYPEPEIWNSYELNKLSTAIVGNADLQRYQCFNPLNDSLAELPIPFVWESDYVDVDHGYYYTLVHPSPNSYDVSACWVLQNEFGNVMQSGYTYGLQPEWDSALLIARFDNFYAYREQSGCEQGSLFMIVADEALVIVSTQCSDTVTGQTYLAHIHDVVSSNAMCPSTRTLTKRDQANDWLSKISRHSKFQASDESDQSDSVSIQIDSTLVANYATIFATGQGIVGLVTGDYGGTISIKNYLCGGNLIYETAHFLVKGYFKAHCSTIYGGQGAGCTLSGFLNSGAYGTVQYQLKTQADDGGVNVMTLNIVFQMSRGFFGIGSQNKNRVDVFWSNTVCVLDETTKGDPSCFVNLARLRDDEKCWKQNLFGTWFYEKECSIKHDDGERSVVRNGIKAVGRIGGGNNPEVSIEVRVEDDPIGKCGTAPSS